LADLKEWHAECKDDDDWVKYVRGRESEIAPEAYGAIAIKAYEPKHQGWMKEMEIANKGDFYAWVKKKNVEDWKASE
jgi:hypothetical protein